MAAVIDYPKVVLSGITFYFKYSLASLQFAAKYQISGDTPVLTKVIETAEDGTPTKFAAADFSEKLAIHTYIAEQASVCAHLLDDFGLIHADMSPSRISAMIDPSDIGRIQAAIEEAAGKVTPAATTSPAQPAVQAP